MAKFSPGEIIPCEIVPGRNFPPPCRVVLSGSDAKNSRAGAGPQADLELSDSGAGARCGPRHVFRHHADTLEDVFQVLHELAERFDSFEVLLGVKDQLLGVLQSGQYSSSHQIRLVAALQGTLRKGLHVAKEAADVPLPFESSSGMPVARQPPLDLRPSSALSAVRPAVRHACGLSWETGAERGRERPQICVSALRSSGGGGVGKNPVPPVVALFPGVCYPPPQ